MKTKVIILFAAGGAAGKTTTRRAFAIGEPEEHREPREVLVKSGMEIRDVLWTYYDNCAVCGNHHSGSDSNTGPGLIKEAMFETLKHRDITIVDGMLLSPRWATMCNEWQEEHPDYLLQVLLIHFNLDPEDLMDRLAMRRGTDKETFRERMYPRCKSLIRRAQLLVEHFQNLCECRWDELDIYVEDTTEDIVEMMDDAMCDYFKDCED
jgi:hypothetical protein